MSDKDLVRRLRNLVSLNEVEHGGPYRGTAATLCVEAMAEAADELARIKAAVDQAWERRDDIEDPFVQGWLTGLLETLDGFPPYSKTVATYDPVPLVPNEMAALQTTITRCGECGGTLKPYNTEYGDWSIWRCIDCGTKHG